MGQILGKLPIQSSFSQFVNLPKSVIVDLRCAVAEVSESGYSLTLDELEQVLVLSLHVYLSDEKIREYNNDLFSLFNADALPGQDCDEIDSFELIGTLCLTSGMPLREKAEFLFDLFDLNEKAELSINEVTLAFRSLVSGARKITIGASIVSNEEIDQVALDAFDLITPESLKYSVAMTDDQKLTRQQFCDYALNCPEAVSFMDCYDDIVIGQSNNIAADASAKASPARLMADELDEEGKTLKQPMGEPWRDQQRFLRPDIAGEKERASPPPMDGLQLDRICGRNSGTEAVYTSDGDVLYAAGSMVVKLVADNGGYNQDFFNEHSNRVSSLAIFHAKDGMGDTVASSDTGGDNCKVCVWSSQTLSSQVTFSTRHKNGVSKLSFSPSGEVLLTMGHNDMNLDSTIAIYKWGERSLLFTAKMPGSKFFDSSFLCSDNSFGVCGEDFVHFWSKAESNEPFKHCRGATNLCSSQVQMTSIACVDGAVITGSVTSRALWLWEGRVCVKRVEVFRFPITKLFANSVVLLLSTKDGTIHLLDKELGIQRRFDKSNRSNNHIIDTLCYDTNKEKILVGDNSCCLREVYLNGDSKFVTSCHSALTDFTFDTLNDNIVTIGEDGFVRKWDKDARAVLQQHYLERGLSCIAYKRGDGDKQQLAVGFCRNDTCCSSDKTDVAFVILCGNDLTNIIHYGHNSQMTLTVCEFSHDGKLLAFGSKDSSIYIHSTEKDFPLIAKARGHSTPILSLDFGCANDSSESASFLRSNSISGEVMYWSTHAKKQTPLSQRHTRWESQTCAYGWYLEGAHDFYTEEGNEGITSCCPLPTGSIVVGDSIGRLRVLPNPALSKESVHLQFTSHHGKVQTILLVGDSLYTLGKDSCLCKWKVSSLSWPPTMPPSLYDDHVLIDEKKEDQDLSVSLELATAQMEDLDFSIRHADKASSNLKPFRPWMRSIVPPSNYVPQLGPLPNSSLVLERIHGYGSSANDNLHYISSGESIVSSVGRTLVRYDEVGDKQQFCSVDERIKCLAIHQERLLCAIGQENAKQGIVIVDLKTMDYMSLCKSAAQSLDFDESGQYVLALSGSRLTIHDIDNKTIIASTLTHTTETLDVRFTTKANAFVEVGRNFVRLWSVKGGDMSFEEVDMSSMENPTTFYTCAGWMDNDLIVGASTGNVIRFAGTTPISKIKAHTSKITNIATASDGRFTISAATSIKLYDSKFRCIIAIDTELLGVRHQISSLSWHEDTRKIIIGTEGNEVWELSSDDGSNINDGPLISAHASSPMAICANPNGATFASVADDGFLRVWGDENENTSFDLTMPSRACAYSPSGGLLAVGFGKPVKDTAKTINGKWVVIDVNVSSYRIIAERRDSRSFIREMKWHCNGDRLAVGSDKIYVYQVISETNPAIKIDISLVSTIDMTSPPNHFDLSIDGKYLRVNSEANELMWFEADPAIRISEASLMKDIEWESHTCVFDWNVQGTHHPEGWEVRSLDCYTEDCSCVVTGGDDGVLRQYSYPCASTRANYLSYAGHGGAVTSVMILKGGSHVISAGDGAIMVWRHEIDENYGDHLLSERQESSLVNAVDATDMYPSALYVSSDYQIMYPTSGVCAVLDVKRNTQNLFQRHDSQIGAVATSTSRQLVASGDSCSDFPTKVWIWDPQTCTEIASLSDSRLRGVSVLAFSPDEKKLACICSDENHRIFVWSTFDGSWSDAYLSAYSLGGHEQISFVQFTQTQLIIGGRKNLNFWSFAPNLSLSKGVVSTQNRDDTLLCGAMMEGKLITGTSDGSFVVWNLTEKKIIREFKAHNSRVTSLCACPEGIISGCSDGSITIWSSDTFQKKRSFDVGTTSAIHSLDICLHSNGLSTMKILAVSDSNCFVVSCITGNVTSAAKIPTAGEVSSC